MNKILISSGIILLVGILLTLNNEEKENYPEVNNQIFINDGLKTNTDKTSIDLNQILDGGPGKDGIPSINDPKFVPISESNLSDDTMGILVQSGDESKFYPYNILVWHEIVNDTINNTGISITFCPLCGSAIVFERGNKLFGVSGKLFESNLLMYDNITESLWSQALGEAVVGDSLGEKLNIYPSNIITQGEVKDFFPDTLLLSSDTGYSRDYSRYPYGDYNETEKLIFPTSVQDKRFPAKTLLYVVPDDNRSVAFIKEDLLDKKEAEKVGINAVVQNDGTIVATKDGVVISGYIQMWFSWSTHHKEDGLIWSLEN